MSRRGPSRRLALACAGLLAFTASPAVAHEGGHGHDAMWSACEAHQLDDQCAFAGDSHEVHRGTCQAMVEQLACVRNQPIEQVPADVTTLVPVQVRAMYSASSTMSTMDWVIWLLGSVATSVGLLALMMHVLFDPERRDPEAS